MSMHIVVICLFPLLYSIPLHDFIVFYLSILPLMDICVVSKFVSKFCFAVGNISVTFLYMSPDSHGLGFLQDIYLG